MPAQLDEGGGRTLRAPHRGARRAASTPAAHPVDRVATATRPDARSPSTAPTRCPPTWSCSRPASGRATSSPATAGSRVGERGGIVVDDALRTERPGDLRHRRVRRSSPAGSTASWPPATRWPGSSPPTSTPTPGRRRPTTASWPPTCPPSSSCSASASPTSATSAPTPTRHSLVWEDPVAGVYRRLDVDDDGRVLAAVLVGDTRPTPTLLDHFRRGRRRADDPGVAAPRRPAGRRRGAGDGSTPPPLVCSCENVTGGDPRRRRRRRLPHRRRPEEAHAAPASGCGGCVPLVEQVLRSSLERRGEAVDDSPVRALRPLPGRAVRPRSGSAATGPSPRSSPPTARATAGCEICRPAVASILAIASAAATSSTASRRALQDTNDHFLANLQKDGTYSVVPRIPGGEITPEKLIVIGEVARDFDLYTKITGGQRIDLFGATGRRSCRRSGARLVDAGFESGHAYGKSLRTVKSCVGRPGAGTACRTPPPWRSCSRSATGACGRPTSSSWPSPGCARECAEAQSKDVGVIATERGWNLFVGGNGGTRPRHADLFAEDLDDETLVAVIDRFLMYYVRTGERLERTATWVERRWRPRPRPPGGPRGRPRPRRRARGGRWQAQVDAYECEWKATLEDPERLRRFVTLRERPRRARPTVVFVRERGQIRPATAPRRPPPPWPERRREPRRPGDRPPVTSTRRADRWTAVCPVGGPGAGPGRVRPGRGPRRRRVPLLVRRRALRHRQRRPLHAGRRCCPGAWWARPGDRRAVGAVRGVAPAQAAHSTSRTGVSPRRSGRAPCRRGRCGGRRRRRGGPRGDGPRSASDHPGAMSRKPRRNRRSTTLTAVTLGSLSGYTVAITADRRWEEQAELIERRGGSVLHGPVIRTLPLADEAGLREATRALIARSARHRGAVHGARGPGLVLRRREPRARRRPARRPRRRPRSSSGDPRRRAPPSPPGWR